MTTAQKQPAGDFGSTAGLGMRVGVRYIVTHNSADKEFQCGDRIRLCADGTIENIDAQCADGWMEAEDVPSATRGMTFVVDAAWLERQRERLAAQMAALCMPDVGAKRK